jgi:hypothetical protein
MVVVNYYREEDYNPNTDGYHLHLAAVINDVLDLNNDIQLMIECIDNDPNFNPKNGVLYEIFLTRATIAADPIPEPAFAIDRVVEKKYTEEQGWHTPIIRL